MRSKRSKYRAGSFSLASESGLRLQFYFAHLDLVRVRVGCKPIWIIFQISLTGNLRLGFFRGEEEREEGREEKIRHRDRGRA